MGTVDLEMPMLPTEALCMACDDSTCVFKPRRIQRRPLGDLDVLIDVGYCGVCHSDLHFAAGHLDNMLKTNYPCTPGHEVAGVVAAVGRKVTKFQVGDHIGVGCMVDACLACEDCQSGNEQKCLKQVQTYQGEDWSGRAASFPKGEKTIGGYSTKYVVTEHFGIKIQKNYPLEAAGPIMCAGITVYDPLKLWGAGDSRKQIGVVGIRGLGLMGIKIARAMGCTVTSISRCNAKSELARQSGAEAHLRSTDDVGMAVASGSLDLILNTIPVNHDWAIYEPLLAPHGKQVLLGLHASLAGAMMASALTFGSSRVTASGIGGIQNTQEVMDLCVKHNIQPDLDVRKVQELPQIYEALGGASDAGKRFVLDLSSLDEQALKIGLDLRAPDLGESLSDMTMGGICYEFWRMMFRTVCGCGCSGR